MIDNDTRQPAEILKQQKDTMDTLVMDWLNDLVSDEGDIRVLLPAFMWLMNQEEIYTPTFFTWLGRTEFQEEFTGNEYFEFFKAPPKRFGMATRLQALELMKMSTFSHADVFWIYYFGKTVGFVTDEMQSVMDNFYSWYEGNAILKGVDERETDVIVGFVCEQLQGTIATLMSIY